MPNWCHNTLKVHGSIVDLAAFLKQAEQGAEDGNALTFAAFVPVPENVAPGPSGYSWMGRDKYGAWTPCDFVRDPADPERRIPDPAQGLTEVDSYEYVTLANGTRLTKADAKNKGIIGRYDWNVANWGTKWDAETTHVDDSALLDGYVTLFFATAWSPPTPVIHAMQAAHPRLRIGCHSVEPGMGFQVLHGPSGRVEQHDYVDVDGFFEDDFDLEEEGVTA